MKRTRFSTGFLASVVASLAGSPQQAGAVDFDADVKPILEQNCLSCHSGEHIEGDFDLSTRTAAFETGWSAPAIVAKEPDESPLYYLAVVDVDDSQLMPPVSAGGPLTQQQIEVLRTWIVEGAAWPEGVTLTAKAKPRAAWKTPDDLELVRKIHELIVERSAQDANGAMSDYEAKVPLTGASYSMKAIPGGKFLMGSPPSEAHRKDDEGPQVEVQIAPFWMGKCEVTWDEYEPFMITQVDREKHGARKDFDPDKHTMVDAVSAPTAPYMEMSFGMGQSGYPAISMTQHAANKYCQWLSAQTGHFYRLPTEAEWEYACRAGGTTAYSFGDDPAELDAYAWHYENSDEKYQKVGQKKPNPWGLHDMHGNVMEWTADRYAADYFSLLGSRAKNPYLRPEKLYPRSVRGGGWDDDPQQLRSAARRGSDPTWKQQDPQLPKSMWYHTDALWLGFRLCRPQEIPSAEEMYLVWNSGSGLIR